MSTFDELRERIKALSWFKRDVIECSDEASADPAEAGDGPVITFDLTPIRERLNAMLPPAASVKVDDNA